MIKKSALLKLFILIVLMLTPTPADSLPKQTYDDFAGDMINDDLWTIKDDNHVFSQSGGFLQVDGPKFNVEFY